MKQVVAALLAIALCAPAAMPASQDDVSAPIRQFIDDFNTGNVQAAFATYASGVITIVDEFAPHVWTGPDAAHQWADAYNKHAQATGVTDGKVTYGEPTRTEVEGDVAYVVMPTVYLYKEHGKPLREEAQMTVVLNHEEGAGRFAAGPGLTKSLAQRSSSDIDVWAYRICTAAMSGETAKAKAAYQVFLTLWKDSDPDIPILKQTKAEYAKLK